MRRFDLDETQSVAVGLAAYFWLVCSPLLAMGWTRAVGKDNNTAGLCIWVTVMASLVSAMT